MAVPSDPMPRPGEILWKDGKPVGIVESMSVNYSRLGDGEVEYCFIGGARLSTPLSFKGETRADVGPVAKEAGLDPMKAGNNVMFAAMVREWRDGRWTREQFIHACKNLAILNPSLK